MKTYVGQLLISGAAPSMWKTWDEKTCPNDVVGKLKPSEACLCIEGPKDLGQKKGLMGIKVLTSSGIIGWTYQRAFRQC